MRSLPRSPSRRPAHRRPDRPRRRSRPGPIHRLFDHRRTRRHGPSPLRKPCRTGESARGDSPDSAARPTRRLGDPACFRQQRHAGWVASCDVAWSRDRVTSTHLRLFQARRADIECFARDLATRGRARATITRRLCTIAGFYRYAVEEDLLDHSPAAHVRRPRLGDDSHATGLDRNELGALLVAAGLGSPVEHAVISLLALNGLRVSEAAGANIEALGIERGHRTLVITRKGGKVVTIPLAPRTARAIDLAVGVRVDGSVFLALNGQRLDRHGAARIVRPCERDDTPVTGAGCSSRWAGPVRVWLGDLGWLLCAVGWRVTALL
jgi:hypothetical protein